MIKFQIIDEEANKIALVVGLWPPYRQTTCSFNKRTSNLKGNIGNIINTLEH